MLHESSIHTSNLLGRASPAAFPMRPYCRAAMACLLVILLLGEPAIAQSGIAPNGIVMRAAVFFAGRQGRWTLLTAWTILFGTLQNYDLALSCARKAVQISEGTHDDERLATSQHYLAIVLEAKGMPREAEKALQASLAVRQRKGGGNGPAVADALVALARNQRLQGKFSEALPMLTRAMMLRAKTFGEGSAQYSDVLLEQARVFSALQQYAESEKLLRQAVAIKLEVFGSSDPDTGEAQRNLAESLAQQKRYAEAEVQAKAALTSSETFLDKDDPLVLPPLGTLITVYEAEGKIAEARELRERKAQVRKHGMEAITEGNEKKQWAKLVGRSFMLFNAGEFADETGVALAGLRYAELKFGPEDWRVAAFLVVLGEQYYSGQAAYSKAEMTTRRAIRIQEKALGTEDASLSETLLSYGWLLETQRKYRQAESAYLKAMDIQEHAMNIRVAEDPYMHSPRLSLAALFRLQGKFPEAEKLLTDAIKVQGQASGPEPPRNRAMAELLAGLAYTYEDEQKPDRAVSLLQQALTYNSKAWGIGWGFYKRLSVGLSYNDLGTAYIQKHSYREAEAAYLKATKLAGGSQTTAATRVRWNLAFAYRLQGKFAEAEKILQQELSAAVRSRYNWHIDQTSKQLAYLYIAQGRYLDAGPLLQRSLQIEQETMPDSPGLATTLYDLAVNDDALGYRDIASRHFEESFAILSHELQYYFTFMSEAERLAMLQQVEYRFPTFYSFVERYHQDDPGLSAQMYNLLLWKKGLVARSIESLRRKIAISNDAEAIKLFDELAGRRAQISKYLNDPSSGSAEWRRKMLSFEEQANEVESSLVARSQLFANLQKQQSATWDQVRESLKQVNGDAAIEFVRFPFRSAKSANGKPGTESVHYVALIVTPHCDAPSFVPLGEADTLEGEPFRAYRRWVRRPLYADVDPSSARGAVQSFYESLWKKVETVLEPTVKLSGSRLPRLYVSPDGVLNEVSLGVLPNSEGVLLVEKYDLRLVNSTVDLVRELPLVTTNTAVLIGNPSFRLAEPDQQQALAQLKGHRLNPKHSSEASLTPTQAASVDQVPLDEARRDQNCTEGGPIDPLNETEGEVNDIFKLLEQHKWDADPPYLQDLALEEAVKQVTHPRLLHVATHGFFCPDIQSSREHNEQERPPTFADPMLRSGLLFASAERTLNGETPIPNAEDGILTAYEATMLDLEGTELVVLSACKTGLGEKLAGEGVFGLRRAIQEAGAQAVLISMWAVPDVETRQLMSFFYRYWLSGKDKHLALRMAQLDLRAQLAKSGNDWPYFWGAFVLVGR